MAKAIDKRLGIDDLDITHGQVTSIRKTIAKKKTGNPNPKAAAAASARAVKDAIFLLDNGLTPEQEAYARCRAYGMTQKESVTFATNGKTTSTGAGSEMEKHFPLVRERINKLSQEVSQRVIEAAAVNKGWVIDRLKKVAERCMVAEPVMVFNKDTKEMEETGEYTFDSAGANRALELIGKELGMFTTKIDVNNTPMSKLSPEQVHAMACELAEELGMPMPAPLIRLPAPG